MWNPQFEAQWKQLQGKRWRLGQNHWTNLDTNIDLEASLVIVFGPHRLTAPVVMHRVKTVPK